jgi:acyl dehydratase
MPLDPKRLLALTIAPRKVAYAGRDSLLYALAAGMGCQGNPEDLAFIWEEGQRVMPSMATMLASSDAWLQAAGIDRKQVVQEALDLHVHKPMAPEGEALAEARVLGLDDKGAGGAGLVFLESLVSQNGGAACTIRSTISVRGGGGFGGALGEQLGAPDQPAGPPHTTSRQPTSPNQALLFRLLGDRNPLHIDPGLARQMGFDRPVLHGACTFGIACAELLRLFCDHEPARLTRLAARFAGPLYPGETLNFCFWRNGPEVAFCASAAERGAVVLDHGLAVLKA